MTKINMMRPNDEFVGFYLIKELELKQTNSTPSKDYFDILLSDSTGQLQAKLWDVLPKDKESLSPMILVKVQGVIQLFREKPQAKIIRIRKVTETDGVILSEYIRTAPISSNDLVTKINEVVSTITDSEIKQIVSYCVSKVENKLGHYPAAKAHHHAYFAGLAYHIVRMLEIADFIARQRPFLNNDLIKAGIILHDIAKPEEMVAELGMVSDYSTKGKLIGHIALVSNWITEAAIQHNISLDSERVLHLHHLVLSHHNLGEWGSPVQPQTAEAIALHYIDMLDAKLQMVEDAIDTKPLDSEWTLQIRALENKAMYITNIKP